jgi:glycine cleavage system aminomethyltransferase T
MSKRDTIYVALLDEGIDVWRPVAAQKLSPDTYLIVDRDYDPRTERWAFEPGTVVRCRKEERDGREILVATEVASQPAAGQGTANSGGNYGFRLEKSLALAMVRPELSEPGTELEMAILGDRHRVTVIPESPYDPENQRLRG